MAAGVGGVLAGRGVADGGDAAGAVGRGRERDAGGRALRDAGLPDVRLGGAADRHRRRAEEAEAAAGRRNAERAGPDDRRGRVVGVVVVRVVVEPAERRVGGVVVEGDAEDRRAPHQEVEDAGGVMAVVVAVCAGMVGDHEEAAAVLHEAADRGDLGRGEDDVRLRDDEDVVVREVLGVGGVVVADARAHRQALDMEAFLDEVDAHRGEGAGPVGLSGRRRDPGLIGRREPLRGAACVFVERPVGVAGGLRVRGVEENGLLLGKYREGENEGYRDTEGPERELGHPASIHRVVGSRDCAAEDTFPHVFPVHSAQGTVHRFAGATALSAARARS